MAMNHGNCKRQVLSKICNGIPEDFDPVAFTTEASARPLRVLCCKKKTFRVRHQAEDPARGVANAGNVRDGTIRILRFRQQINSSRIAGRLHHLVSGRRPITCGNLSVLTQRVQQRWMLECNSALGVSHRDVKFINAPQEDAVAGCHFQSHPAVGVPAVAVPGQSDLIFPRFFRCVFNAATHQQTSLQNRLKSVADAEHQFVGLQEFSHGFVELTSKLAGKNHTCTKVVAIAESARDTQNLIPTELGGIFEEAEKMNSIRRRTGQLKRMSRFNVTIRSRGS